MSLLIVGSVAIDDIRTQEADKKNLLGGSASYASVAASFFCPVKMVGIVGEDFPLEYHDLYKRHKIDLEGLQIVPGKTFRWGGVYEKDMNQRSTLFTELNVFADFSPRLPVQYQNSPYVLLANIGPNLQLEVLKQMSRPQFVIADTMDLWIHTAREQLLELLEQVDFLILNDSEARQLSGEHNLLAAARKLHGMGPKYVIIKKGEHGSFLSSAKGMFATPAVPLEAIIDPTGAGDTFAGALAGYLAQTGDLSFENIKQGLIEATLMSSFTVEDFSLNRLIALTEMERKSRRQLLQSLTEW